MFLLKSKYQVALILLFVTGTLFSQSQPARPGGAGNQEGPEQQNQGTSIKPDIRAWHLIDDFTFADTTAVDTLSNGYQVYNPIYQRSIANAHLGNLNTAYQSMILEDRETKYGNLFSNAFRVYLPDAKDLYFYNTKTPYVNLTYHFGGPKRRSEERIRVAYTQNVNKAWNVGAEYLLSSSVGQYQAQKADSETFRFFSSYDGVKYNFQAAFIYSKLKTYENGGLNRDKVDFEFQNLSPESVVVQFNSAERRITNRKLFFNHSLGIGNISVSKDDSIEVELPVSKIYHTFELEQDNMEYFIPDLPSYYTQDVLNPFYPNINSDTLQTMDSVRVNTMRNTFQIKFNEEANSLLKFGVRAYIVNDVSFYQFPKKPTNYDIVDGDYIPHYINTDTTLVTTALGGQIFKNLGKNFWWNAGVKIYFQGYRAGDSEITGKINSSFRIANDTAGFYGSGGIYLTTPELFETKYYSNHLQWDHNFGQKRTVRFKGGIRIPTKHLELSAEGRFMNNHIYWNFDGTPDQTDGVIQVYNARLTKLFNLGRFHSHNEVVYQHSSDQDIIPLPALALFNSTYYQNTLFKVLHFQLGFDFRYHTSYYAPFYMPATAQFTNQSIEKVGNYPWFDVFVNLQLKRARIYVKFDHVNQGYPNEPYYTTYNYPGNPRALKFGVSWNFYD